MCTVTFIPVQDGFILSSNRDETIHRRTLPPSSYFHGTHRLIYPKDEEGGGTWIATASHGVMACLLNGGFDRHIRKLPYKISRGKILIESLLYGTGQLDSLSLESVEPFTLIRINLTPVLRMHEVVWTGQEVVNRTLSEKIAHLWSSSTLYSSAYKTMREVEFLKWISSKQNLSLEDIAQFHENNYYENIDPNLLTFHSNSIKTVSITQIQVIKKQIKLIYKDNINHTEHHLSIHENDNRIRFGTGLA